MRVLAVNARRWQPTSQEFVRALRLVQQEEQERICRFRFVEDAKASLLGRLLIRHVIAHREPQLANCKLVRSSTGKPDVEAPVRHAHPGLEHFNVSHSGALAVVAACSTGPVGIDLADVRQPLSESVERFFELMRDVFTPNEWAQVRAPSDEASCLRRFYVFWSLKESFVKLTGDGVGYGLQRIDFSPDWSVDATAHSEFVSRAQVSLDGVEQSDYGFAQTWIDPKHVAAIAWHRRPHKASSDASVPVPPVQTLTSSDLLETLDRVMSGFGLWAPESQIVALYERMLTKKER